VFDGGLEDAFRGVYGRDDDIWHRGEWKAIRQLCMGVTIGIIRVDMEWGSGVGDGVDPVQDVIKCPRLSRSLGSTS
jgi:hypothetical protein